MLLIFSTASKQESIFLSLGVFLASMLEINQETWKLRELVTATFSLLLRCKVILELRKSIEIRFKNGNK